MRKVDIRSRIRELDAQLLNGKATRAGQREERERLVEACRAHGDHVLDFTLIAIDPPDWAHVCDFCGVQRGAGAQQVRRNLIRA